MLSHFLILYRFKLHNNTYSTDYSRYLNKVTRLVCRLIMRLCTFGHGTSTQYIGWLDIYIKGINDRSFVIKPEKQVTQKKKICASKG